MFTKKPIFALFENLHLFKYEFYSNKRESFRQNFNSSIFCDEYFIHFYFKTSHIIKRRHVVSSKNLFVIDLIESC